MLRRWLRGAGAFLSAPIACAVTLAGCSLNDPGTPSGEKAARNSTATVSEARAGHFGAQVEKAVRGGDRQGLLSLIDWDAIIDRSLEGIEAGAVPKGEFQAFRDKTRREIKDSLTGPNGLLTRIIDGVKRGGSYTYVRSSEREGRQRRAVSSRQPPHIDRTSRHVRHRTLDRRLISPGGAAPVTS